MARTLDNNLSMAAVAAARFWAALLKRDAKEAYADPGPVYRLCLAAFMLHQHEWNSGADIDKWQWPFDVLDAGEEFPGNEPWTVLLREAVHLACTKPLTRQPDA